jgi:hypothetical protein
MTLILCAPYILTETFADLYAFLERSYRISRDEANPKENGTLLGPLFAAAKSSLRTLPNIPGLSSVNNVIR